MSSSYRYGPVLLPDYEDLQALAELVAFAARRRREYGAGLSRAEYRAVELVLTTAEEWRRRTAGVSDRGTDLGSDLAITDSEIAAFTWIDTREAAAKAQTSQRAIVAAVHRGVLEAQRCGRGRGRWRVTEASVEAWVGRRNHSNTDTEGERAA